MNNAVFEKTMPNERKHRNIKLVTTEWKKLFSNRIKFLYYKVFTENLLSIEIRKT